MESSPVSPEVNNGPQRHQSLTLANRNDMELFCPIRYIYNYFPQESEWLKSQPISLSRIFAESKDCKSPFFGHRAKTSNSIRLYTQEAKLPLHTGLEEFRQNIFWKANEEATKELLELFAQDQRCSEIILSEKRSMSSLAQDQLRTAIVDTYSRYSIYTYPEADKTRIQLIGQSVILVFLFDDVWEDASPEMIEILREEFISRLRGSKSFSSTDTPLERRIDTIRQGLLDGDKEGGNGGAEILQTLIDFCYHSAPPREDFSSGRDYLDYRWNDVGNSIAWALAKFSICSSVNQENLKLHRILRLLGDQISIANDIASYEKEKRHFEAGKTTSVINLVDVITKIDRMETMAAKSMAYAWQLWTEDEILKELQELKKRDELSMEDWRFLEACLGTASGMVLTSVVIARYGGEDARIA